VTHGAKATVTTATGSAGRFSTGIRGHVVTSMSRCGHIPIVEGVAAHSIADGCHHLTGQRTDSHSLARKGQEQQQNNMDSFHTDAV
jgi:hypothetical protein